MISQGYIYLNTFKSFTEDLDSGRGNVYMYCEQNNPN